MAVGIDAGASTLKYAVYVAVGASLMATTRRGASVYTAW
jgi:hypothetical protein